MTGYPDTDMLIELIKVKVMKWTYAVGRMTRCPDADILIELLKWKWWSGRTQWGEWPAVPRRTCWWCRCRGHAARTSRDARRLTSPSAETASSGWTLRLKSRQVVQDLTRLSSKQQLRWLRTRKPLAYRESTCIVILLKCTQSADNVFHSFTVLWEKEFFLTNNLLCPFH